MYAPHRLTSHIDRSSEGEALAAWIALATSYQRFLAGASSEERVADVASVKENGALAMGHLIQHRKDQENEEECKEQILDSILPGRSFVVPPRSAFLLVRACI